MLWLGCLVAAPVVALMSLGVFGVSRTACLDRANGYCQALHFPFGADVGLDNGLSPSVCVAVFALPLVCTLGGTVVAAVARNVRPLRASLMAAVAMMVLLVAVPLVLGGPSATERFVACMRHNGYRQLTTPWKVARRSGFQFEGGQGIASFDTTEIRIGRLDLIGVTRPEPGDPQPRAEAELLLLHPRESIAVLLAKVSEHRSIDVHVKCEYSAVPDEKYLGP